ncbi:hypothetical protein GQ43DRAFT_313647 [Delitschia confertaspora ATCC 74209]|uniref:PWWP domain-containing protein n=1 Tax=Delitschia confertaspora ATCC 74209 TaxID=1513339 RepID=A0A9P4JNK0_9PLEO|nr:hypothetical protein GQ43DRAFT_313647 [Delitschia confertaspora ATCC 74209]
MNQFRPGDWVLASSEWPAFVCTEDMLPKRFLKGMPKGFSHPVLFMSDFKFRWVPLGELSPLDPKSESELHELPEQVQQAYREVYSAWQNDSGLEHWKVVIGASGFSDDADTSDSWDLDNEPKIDQFTDENPNSRLGKTREGSHGFSPLEKCQSSAFPRDKENLSFDRDGPKLGHKMTPHVSSNLSPLATRLEQNFLSSPQAAQRSPPKRAASPILAPRATKPRRDLISTPDALSRNTECNENSSKGLKFKKGLALPQNGLPATKSSTVALCKPADSQEDVSADNRIVTFFIGADNEEFVVPRESVTERSYFRDILALENNKLVMRRGAYRLIDPTKFKWAADYLSTCDFGHRIPQIELERKEVMDANREDIFLQCAEAYEVASEMVMDDLMTLILKKLEAIRPWPPLLALSFASNLFRASHEAEFRSDEEEQLMRAFGKYLADNFWYLTEEHLSSWKDKLALNPALAEEVFRNLAEKAKRQLRRQSRVQDEGTGSEREEERMADGMRYMLA